MPNAIWIGDKVWKETQRNSLHIDESKSADWLFVFSSESKYCGLTISTTPNIFPWNRPRRKLKKVLDTKRKF